MACLKTEGERKRSRIVDFIDQKVHFQLHVWTVVTVRSSHLLFLTVFLFSYANHFRSIQIHTVEFRCLALTVSVHSYLTDTTGQISSS